MFREINVILIIILSVIFFILGKILWLEKSTENRKVLNKVGGIAIGVTDYFASAGHKSIDVIWFSYVVDGKSYHCSDKYCFEDSEKAALTFSKGKMSKGDKFIVLYDTEDVENSIIRLDYPIQSSIDFREHVNEFETRRKYK